jgi:hypothetical protein
MGRRTNAAIVTAAAATLVAALAGPAAAETTINTVTVHADQPIAILAANAIGANTPIWNPNLTHPVVASRIRTAGLRTLAFNGGRTRTPTRARRRTRATSSSTPAR